jgi:hypothetical protein
MSLGTVKDRFKTALRVSLQGFASKPEALLKRRQSDRPANIQIFFTILTPKTRQVKLKPLRRFKDASSFGCFRGPEATKRSGT